MWNRILNVPDLQPRFHFYFYLTIILPARGDIKNVFFIFYYVSYLYDYFVNHVWTSRTETENVDETRNSPIFNMPISCSFVSMLTIMAVITSHHMARFPVRTRLSNDERRPAGSCFLSPQRGCQRAMKNLISTYWFPSLSVVLICLHSYIGDLGLQLAVWPGEQCAALHN